MPIREAGEFLTTGWFPMLVLLEVLMRVALALIVLAMVKDRKEREQRIAALTHSLTGLPNPRALFEAADAVAQRRILGGTPVSVLIFDGLAVGATVGVGFASDTDVEPTFQACSGGPMRRSTSPNARPQSGRAT